MKPAVRFTPQWGQYRLAAVCGIVCAVLSGQSLAVGTASNTSITNRATLTFSVGGVPQTGIESSSAGNSTPGVGAGADTSFLVDNKVDVLVTEGDSTFTSVSPGQLAAVTTYTVTNQGNTTQDFNLVAANEANGTLLFTGTDNFDGTSCSAFAESGATVGYQAAQDTGAFVDEAIADATPTVYVVCDIPAGQLNNDNAVVSLVATARAGGAAGSQGAVLTETVGADTAGVDIVFADDTGTDDANRDAAHSARDQFRVVAAVLSVAKTVGLVCDPFNSTTNPKNIPGAIVRWTVTVSNAGGAGSSATLAQISDALNANSTFDPDLITGAGGAAACEGLSGGTGSPLSANGSGFRMDVTGDTRGGYPKFFTTANDTDGADLNGTTVEIDYGPALPVEAGYSAGELKPGESVVVDFNVSIN